MGLPKAERTGEDISVSLRSAPSSIGLLTRPPLKGTLKKIHHVPSLPPFDLTQTRGTEEGLNPQIIELILWLDWKMNYLLKL